jgi:ubiquinone/menaquinone biosynthesis C-methylase UbiE
MSSLFGTEKMAAGYATSRPALHSQVIERIRQHRGIALPMNTALDVGCGAGLSTHPLREIAVRCLGLEPAEAMLRWTRTVAPGAEFLVGRAEALPVRSNSIDMITAAGSLNYADLSRFFPEARRVLRPGGSLVVYDYSQGRGLDAWFSDFMSRYPPPVNSAHKITPESLQSLPYGFRVDDHEYFDLHHGMNCAEYLDYMMTETNVAWAVVNGTPEEEIRDWCAETLSPLFHGTARDFVFPGYIAYLSPA